MLVFEMLYFLPDVLLQCHELQALSGQFHASAVQLSCWLSSTVCGSAGLLVQPVQHRIWGGRMQERVMQQQLTR
jgi:hypothetical protein